ncbi:unnamed protein product [Echinostoma caproni]|uniref:AAA_8 domain-containing protein n=1 Tax=Echinostoma caproni TaxID=27848 RepID=A0A183A256_9TREM|nr:unnamed protein product [Echinostoma caproni]
MNELFEDEAGYAVLDPILFGDYWAAASEEDARLYEDMQDYEVCKAVVEELLFNYRETEGNIDVVLFNDALEHLGAIHRILRLDGGNALLVGVSGSGKKCLARLGAYIANTKTFEVVLRRGYGENEFRDDLKKLYTSMSSNKSDYMFLLCDEHIRDECESKKLVGNPMVALIENSFVFEKNDYNWRKGGRRQGPSRLPV